jgi:hypothetical protein
MMLGEIAQWILKNRKGNAFRGYSLNNIMGQLRYCVDHFSMLCVTNEHNDIVGVVCAKINREDKTCFIDDILTTDQEAIKVMLHVFHENFPGYRLEGFRKNKQKRFNKLEKK